MEDAVLSALTEQERVAYLRILIALGKKGPTSDEPQPTGPSRQITGEGLRLVMAKGAAA